MRLLLVISFLFLPAQAITYELEKRLPYDKAVNKTVKELNTRGLNAFDKHIEIKRGYEYGGYGWHKEGVAYMGPLSFMSPREYYIKILTHEIFHILGAKHNDNPLSIMYHGNLSQASVLDSDISQLTQVGI